MRILVADDDLVAIELVKGVLSDAGHEVTCVGSGVEAMEARRVGITGW